MRDAWNARALTASDRRAKTAADRKPKSCGRGSGGGRRVGSGGAAPFRYIRSAILKMSQPSKASPNSQKSDTATIVPHSRFLQDVYDFTDWNASNNFAKLIERAPFMTLAYA
jgi:hypothetical protein